MSSFPSIEHLNEIFVYHPNTGDLYWSELSKNKRKGRKCEVLSSKGYIRVSIDGRTYAAHRVVFAMATGKWPDDQIDHINGDKADNRISNLREANNRENNRNKKVFSNNRLGVKGVYKRPASGRYQARIMHCGKSICLGTFLSKEDAIDAYNAAAILMHGEFARPNQKGGQHGTE